MKGRTRPVPGSEAKALKVPLAKEVQGVVQMGHIRIQALCHEPKAFCAVCALVAKSRRNHGRHGIGFVRKRNAVERFNLNYATKLHQEHIHVYPPHSRYPRSMDTTLEKISSHAGTIRVF